MADNWTPEEVERLVALKEEGRTWKEIARLLRRSRDSVRHAWRARETVTEEMEKKRSQSEEFRRYQDRALEALKFSEKEIRTEAEALEFFGLDPREWRVKFFECSVHQSPMKLKQSDGTHKATTQNLYRVKGRFEPKEEVRSARDEIRELLDEARKELRSLPAIKIGQRGREGDRLAILSLADLHIDKLALASVTLDHDQCFEIQRATAERAIRGMAERIARDPVGKIWFPVGHDLFNDDERSNKVPVTTNGTPQQSELDWQRVYRETRVFICRMVVEVLGEIAPVFIPIVPGNHDAAKCFFLGDALEIWAERFDHVEVDNSTALRKYYEHGRCLFGMTHTIRACDANPIMSQEAAHRWKGEQYREWLVGHLHQARNTSLRVRPIDVDRQLDGLFVRTLPSLSRADEWHAQQGYIGAIPAGLALVYDPEIGLEAAFPWMEKRANP